MQSSLPLGRWLLPAVAILVAGWIGACGSDPGDSTFVRGGGEDGGPVEEAGESGSFPDSSVDAAPVATALEFDPPLVQLVLDGVAAKTASYRLKATLPDGSTQYVTAQSLQFDRPDLASVTPGATVVLTASGTYAGKGHLHGVYGGKQAQAELDVSIEQRDLGSVSAAVAALLDATGATVDDPALTSLLYPYDATVFPLGLTSPLVMWNEPAGGTHATDVYRLHMEQASYKYDSYSVVPPPAQLRIAQTIWDRMSASNTGDPLKVRLSRWDSATNTAHTSATISLTIAPASLRGAIYYWTASNSGGVKKGHITRFRPGTGAVPEPLNQGRCMGCHAVSADGTTLVAAIDDPSPDGGAPAVPPYVLPWQAPNYTRPWASFDVSLPAAPLIKLSTQYGADIALTPNGTFAVWGAPTPGVPGSRVLSLSDTKTGTLVVASGLDDIQALLTTPGDQLSMPAFSPDGTKLAVVRGPAGDNVLPTPRAIDYLDYDPATHHFAAVLHPVVDVANALFAPTATSGPGLGYPSFTPDSKWIAFHSGAQSTGCQRPETIGGVPGTYCTDQNHDDGDLFFAPVAGGAPIRLAKIDDPPLAADHYSSVEPTFNPQARGGYSWVVFTSMRDWGNKLTGDKINGKRRLWVAAIDVVTGAPDPSHPAFYLEGQEDTPNMRGFWALASCTATPTSGSGGACAAGFECCSGFCDKGVCIDVSTLACAPVGESCKKAIDCCNGGSAVDCVQGVCTLTTPK